MKNMSQMQFCLPNAAATHALGYRLGQQLPAGTVILLQGSLGSGKTTLVQGVGQGLGITEPIDSPTFTLVNEYHSGRIPLYHVDLYRLNAAAIADLDLEAYWEGVEIEPGLVAIEWSERLPHMPPPTYWQITLQHDEQQRQVLITTIGLNVPDFLRLN